MKEIPIPGECHEMPQLSTCHHSSISDGVRGAGHAGTQPNSYSTHDDPYK